MPPNITVLVLVLAFFLASSTSASCDADTLYAGFDVTNFTSDSLRTYLHTKASAGHAPVSYGEAYNVLESIDEHNTSHVRLAYGGYASKCRTGTFYGNECVWNREHLWPQSYGVGESSGLPYYAPPRVDMHALVPSHFSLNSARSNRVFSQITDADDTTCASWSSNWSNGQSCETPVATATTVGAFGSASIGGYWQPPPETRGFIARAMFYLAIRYDGVDEDTFPLRLKQTASKPDVDSNQTYYSFGRLSDLLRWHVSHPVTDWELERNNLVCASQGNRSPFVDHPEVVATVFGTPEEAEAGVDTWSAEWGGDESAAAGRFFAFWIVAACVSLIYS